jgi:hypothetical protein
MGDLDAPSGGRLSRQSHGPVATFVVFAIIAALGVGATLAVQKKNKAKSADDGIVSTAQADRVLRAYWPVHEHALVTGDLQTIAGLDAEPAAEWEKGSVACGCYHVDEPRELISATYLMPKQASYPAFFVAEALQSYKGSNWVDVLVFTKQDATAKWLVSYESGFGPSAVSTSRVASPTANAANAGPTPAQHAVAVTAAADLAKVWQTAKETGLPPETEPFDLRGQTMQRLGSLMSAGQDQIQGNGLFGHYTFTASASDPLFEVATADGSELACQPVRETVVYTAQPGYAVHQDNARKNWGALLAPGDYVSLTSRDVWQTCFLIGANPADPIVVLDSDVGGAIPTGSATDAKA